MQTGNGGHRGSVRRGDVENREISNRYCMPGNDLPLDPYCTRDSLLSVYSTSSRLDRLEKGSWVEERTEEHKKNTRLLPNARIIRPKA